VWGDTIVEENNLDKKISALRKILGERGGGGGEKFIETVRGHGFRFVAQVRRIEDLGFRIWDFKMEIPMATGERRTTN
jgi:DNA-binding winged helix-turn-helix (wHTH) protein